MKKSSMKESLEMKCSECGKVTKHYLSSKGEYRCLICGTVNKTVAPKKNLEVTFEADEELDKTLNPNLEDTQIEGAPVSADLTETPVETI